MVADARAPAVLAGAPQRVMVADARASAVLAPAPLANMVADARAPAVPAPAPQTVMLVMMMFIGVFYSSSKKCQFRVSLGGGRRWRRPRSPCTGS